jgi:ABC-2 type transport system permease protein
VTELHVAIKDLRGALRSRFIIGVALLVPLLVTALFFFAFGGQVRETGKGPGMAPVRAVVVNNDESQMQLGRIVVSTLSSPQLRDIVHCSEISDTAMARHALVRQQADVAVVIPAGFSSAVTDSAGSAEVVLLADPVKTIGPAVVQAVLQRLLDGLSGSKILLNTYRGGTRAAGVAADSRVIAGLMQQYQAAAQAATEAVKVRAPGAGENVSAMFRRMMASIFCGLMVFFAFYTGAYTALSLVREHEDGTLARLFTVPVGRVRILGGKMLSVVGTVALQAVTLVVASTLLFGLRWGQAGGTALALVGTVVASSGFGVMLASLIKSTRQGGPVLGGGLSVAGMLGGLFTQAVPNMPAAFNKVALALPQGWVMRIWNVSIAERSALEMLVPFGVTLAWGAVCFLIGVVVFRRRFA